MHPANEKKQKKNLCWINVHLGTKQQKYIVTVIYSMLGTTYFIFML